MSTNVEEILENRIAQLEKTLFGLEGAPKSESVPDSSIVDSITHASTLISSALSGRDKMNALVQRLPEIESYNESDFEPTDLQTDMQLEYISTMEPEMREYIQKLNQLKELLPVLDSDRFKNLPEYSEKLNSLSLNYIELGEKADVVNSETRSMISRYNDIITNISKTLIDLESKVTSLEKAAEPKKVQD